MCGLAQPLHERFRFGTGARPVAEPVCAQDGTVYVGTAEGYVHAVGPAGEYRWSHTLRGPVTGRAALGAGGAVLVPTARRISAIRADGSLSWVFHSPIDVLGDLVEDSLGRFQFGSADGQLFALSGRGALLAHVSGGAKFSALQAASSRGGVVAGFQNGRVLHQRGGGVETFEMPRGPELVLGCFGSRLCALADGRLFVLAGGKAEPVEREPTAWASSAGAYLALIDRDERTLSLYQGGPAVPSYRTLLPDSVSAPPALDERGRVFVGLRSGGLLAFSPRGELIGCLKVATSALTSVVWDAARARVLATAVEGQLVSVDAPPES